ncbi:protein of unknown function DUF107 [Haloterrigena turkmenica DSM 5511]|uniref:Uncharacterized protein n=1 Tax=Haloterrigena turkmenica (strain ATCC 51198 / DSM 5511 / JCM 9101 / NCIMB 13204 / VKM B-1734 / 4k) TaxID=543526 RepID=D2RXQ3_HALTV|nr:NfeD family protein [Haloterrigena turkmenica]ADB59737.1 protein of unknown function DUF107 [Haloterrigena turkmenica DSM 5511]
MLELLVGNMPLALLIVGLVLMGLEALSPGAHLIVIGVALVGAGLIGVLVPLTLSPIVLAALTLVIGVGAAYVYREFDFYGGKGTARTSDSSSLSGATGYVTETVTARDGQVKLEEGGFSPYYSARSTGGTIEEGEEVIVLDPGGGNVLTVEALGSIGEDEIDRALAKGADDGNDADDAANENSPSEPETETETEKSS